MDCDGLKKILLKDLDGSLLGSQGSVISQSEFGWGDQQRGLGDFRIPKEMLAYPNGSYIGPQNLYSFPGIVRENCTYISDWQAYECFGVRYEMLIIESLDRDTEDRRLSPVAILSEDGYLDLINGPQDHGWCFGYTCQKRISTFMALVAADKAYDVTLSSTPPEKLRFRLLNTDASFKIRLSMYYFTPMRVDLYNKNQFVIATNGEYNADNKLVFVDYSSDLASYMPTYESASGTNLFRKEDKRIFFAADGTGVYDLNIAPVLVVGFGFPSLTPEEFFQSETIVANFAMLLDIDPSMIRRVEIISAAQARLMSHRHGRALDPTLNYVDVIFEENPIMDLNDTASADAIAGNISALNVLVANLYSAEVLERTAQANNLTLASVEVALNEVPQALQTVGSLVLVQEAGQCAAQTPCVVQPKIMVLDANGMFNFHTYSQCSPC